MADILYLALALLLGTLLRLPFHALMPMRFEAGLPAGDFSGVLGKIEFMRRHRWVAYDVEDSVVPGTFGYPVFFHWVVSRFPRRWWRRASVALNVVPDLAAAAGVYAVVRGRLPAAEESPAAIAFLAALLLLTAPILLPVTARLKATNGRAFGLLFVLTALVGTALGIHGAGWGWYVVAVVATALTALTSMFGLQALVFFAPVHALLYLHPAPLAVVAVALAAGLAVPALGIREVLLFKLSHYYWYRRIKTTMSTTASNRTLLRSLRDFLAALRGNRALARRIALYDAPLVILAYSLPALALFGWGIIAGPGPAQVLADPVLRFCLVTTVAAAAVFAVTSTPAFAEWGQSERYFEYAAPMVIAGAVLAGTAAGAAWTVLLVLLCLQLVVLAWMHLYGELPVMRTLLDYPAEPDELEVAGFLAARPGEVRMTALPQQMQRYWPRHFRALPDNRVRHLFGLIRQPGLSPRLGFPYMEELFGEHYQVPAVSLAELHARYGIEWVVALKRFLDSMHGAPFIVALREQCDVAMENGKYVVYRYRDPAGAAEPRTGAARQEDGR